MIILKNLNKNMLTFLRQTLMFHQSKTKCFSEVKRMDKGKQLFRAFMTLKSPKEVENFLKDLCTVSEIADFADRLELARLLENENLSYREIAEQTGASLTTVTRVAKFLKGSNNNGYKTVLKRLKK